MNAFLLAVSDHYPDLLRQVKALDAVIGNRAVEVLDVLAKADGEAPKMDATLRAIVDDFLEASDGPNDPKLLGYALLAAVLRAFQVGLWAGQQGLASWREEDYRRRLKVIEKRTL